MLALFKYNLQGVNPSVNVQGSIVYCIEYVYESLSNIIDVLSNAL